MLEIVPIRPDQAWETKRMIYIIAHELWPAPRTLDQSIAAWEAEGELDDMNDIQHEYFENGGTFLVMLDSGRVIGSGAIRRWDGEICELKRLWFLPEYQGKGLGYRMITRLMEIAREKGYRKMRLETDPIAQSRAQAFYRRLGFHEIPSYHRHSDEIAMEIEL